MQKATTDKNYKEGQMTYFRQFASTNLAQNTGRKLEPKLAKRDKNQTNQKLAK